LKLIQYKYVKEVYAFLVYLLDSLVLITCRKGRENALISIVKLDAIGDFLIWLDSAKEYRKIYPTSNYKLVLICNSICSEIAKSLPYFDEVLPVDRNKLFCNLFYRFKLLKRIQHAGFCQTIHPTFSRDFLYGDSVVRAAGASQRIGSQGDLSNKSSWQKRIGDSWYTQLVPASQSPLMELERNAEFIRRIGQKEFRAGLPQLLPTGKTSDGFNLQEYYVLFPGASSTLRLWPLENFSRLANLIHESTGWTAVICGGRDEIILGSALQDILDVPMENWTGRTSLPELFAFIRGAQMVISNETSAVHIAAAVDTPVVCILGGGHFGRFLPYKVEKETESPLPVPVYCEMPCYNCNWDCIYHPLTGGPAPCVSKVKVEAVWGEVGKILVQKTLTSEEIIQD